MLEFQPPRGSLMDPRSDFHHPSLPGRIQKKPLVFARTPPKTNGWNPKIGGLYSRCFSFFKGVFSGSMFVFRGVNLHSDRPYKTKSDFIGESLISVTGNPPDPRYHISPEKNGLLYSWENSLPIPVFFGLISSNVVSVPKRRVSKYSKKQLTLQLTLT